MPVTVAASGTQTATVTTEHTLATITAAGVYVVQVDLNAMAAGDVLELRAYATPLAAGAERLLYFVGYYGPALAVSLLANSIPVPGDATAGNVRFSLKQTFGVSRAFPWKVLAL